MTISATTISATYIQNRFSKVIDECVKTSSVPREEKTAFRAWAPGGVVGMYEHCLKKVSETLKNGENKCTVSGTGMFSGSLVAAIRTIFHAKFKIRVGETISHIPLKIRLTWHPLDTPHLQEILDISPEFHYKRRGDIRFLLNEERKTDPESCNHTFIVEGRNFPVHRAVLAVGSEYFKTLFSGGFRGSVKTESSFPTTSAMVFEALLDHAYTGIAPLKGMCVGEILELATLADMTGFHDLMRQCHTYLGFLIAQAPLEIAHHAITFDAQSLLDECRAYYLEHPTIMDDMPAEVDELIFLLQIGSALKFEGRPSKTQVKSDPQLKKIIDGIKIRKAIQNASQK